ncbi:hypothetical protein DBR39_15750 [Chryseobacterium sp. KBW03]|jgi:hypothetical protein|uniref:hypothetical protein n=1 Tax=Chryseobacterium sp. KBW03 TaxID=2153362 RepID=UPI000F59FD1E|nr:hypothetical protein [Chryseobacterium sp. KBW03]RQO38315.1 hypothetical protein DBR39_15750 [Chryseobacterium sp. KBW03]
MEKQNTGTPLEYSDSKYFVYFEVYPSEISKLKKIIQQIEGENTFMLEQEFGITCKINNQAIPEIVRELSAHNIAVYGVLSSSLLERSKNYSIDHLS